jgi:hypothetical protein
MSANPELEEIAARARAAYPEYDVGVCYGYLLRAAWRKTATPVPVEETTEERLLTGIARQVRMREMDAQRRERAR